MNINYSRMSPAEKETILAEARVHLEFTMRLIMRQHRAGRHFVFEHPAGAKSWDEGCVKLAQYTTEAITTTFDQCQYGLTSVDTDGIERPVRRKKGIP